MAESTFNLTYEGPALRDGRMDVRMLAPALLGMDELIRVTATRLSLPLDDLSLEVRDIRRGSIAIDMVIVGRVIQQVVDTFSSDEVTALLQLKDVLLLGGSGVGGVFWLYKKLRGRRVVEQEPQQDGQVIQLKLADGGSVEAPADTIKLGQTFSVRRHLREVVSPLVVPGIEAVAFRRELQEEVSVRITEDELDSFDPPEEPELSELEPSFVEHFMATEVVSATFTEGNKWRLADTGLPTSAPFWALITDANFWAKVNGGEEFRKGDILWCHVRTYEVVKEYGPTLEHVVYEVAAHRPGKRRGFQPPMFGDDVA